MELDHLTYKRRKLFPYGVNNLILFICLIFFFISIFASLEMVKLFALYPSQVLEKPWQLITSMFLHVDFWHFFINCFVLLFFGAELERLLGEKGYLKVFFASGIAGNLGYIAYAYTLNSFIPALGASGAIFGIMGCLAMIAPGIRIIIFPIPVPISIRLALLVFALYDFSMLMLTTAHVVGSGVAYIAHLTGLAVGVLIGERIRFRSLYA
ncbi:MAG: rhomboid family intramembrane serine protease [Archaeoglobaceae archaeon]|nr:rhomboid family intramembrane serine protease [Archaeoglobaceae archaeon]MDW8117664.1 rhomboid family intramembrane serine protease [Archaeoglobaceae archaeon]